MGATSDQAAQVASGIKWSERKMTWTAPSGGRLWFSYLDKDDDVSRYQGLSFSWVGFDELTQWVADKLGVQRASVTGALKTLDKKGLINYEPYSFITLTNKGAKIARKITRNHTVLQDFLINVLQIDPKTANETACRMEHAIPEKATKRLISFIEHIHNCPKAGEGWIQSFIKECAKGDRDWQKCEECIKTCQENHPKTGR